MIKRYRKSSHGKRNVKRVTRRQRKFRGGADYERSKEGIIKYFTEKMPRANLIFDDIKDADRRLTAGLARGPMGPIEQYTYRITITHPGMATQFGYINPETGKYYWWGKNNRAAIIEFDKWIASSA